MPIPNTTPDTTHTVTDLFAEIQAAQPDQEARVVHTMTVGQWARQGDIYLVRVVDTHPAGDPCGNQLADGTTQGSRHIAEAPAQCHRGTTPPPNCDSTLCGPRITSKDTFRVSHPEHAHVLLPAGTYQVLRQMDLQTRLAIAD